MYICKVGGLLVDVYLQGGVVSGRCIFVGREGEW